MIPYNLFWTSEKIERLNVILKDFTISQAAKILSIEFNYGITRNSIAGICSRNKMKIRDGRNGDHKKKIPVKISQIPNKRIHPKPVGKIPPDFRIKHMPKPFPPAWNECRAIIGEAKSLKCCAKPIVPHTSWCDQHRQIYFNIPIKKQ